MRLFVLLPITDSGPDPNALLARLDATAQQHRWDVHIVAVDDRSPASAGGINEWSSPLPLDVIAHRFPRGARETVRDGLELIGERCQDDDAVLVLCAPDHRDVLAMPLVLAAIEAGADVVVAARTASMRPGFRHELTQTLKRLPTRALFPIAGVRDAFSPTLAIRGATLRRTVQRRQGRLLNERTPDFLLPLELLDHFANDGARCSQVDVPASHASPPLPPEPVEGPGTGEIQRGHAPPRGWAEETAATFALLNRLRRPTAAPQPSERAIPLARREWGALAALLFVALAIRLYAIQRVPEVVFHDECDNLVNVYQIINGRGPGFFGFDWKPQPAASVYLLSLFMRVGMSILTLRLPAILYSVGALIPFYLLLRRTVAPPAALGATALLATDIWYLHFSRTGWENVATCIFLVAAALTLRNALRTGRWRSFAWTGVWCALGAYGYFAGRAVYPAVALATFFSLLRPRIPRTTIIAGFLLTTVVAFALFAPQMPKIVREWDQFQKRSRTVSILAEVHGAGPTTTTIVGGFFRKGAQIFFGKAIADRYLRMDPGPIAAPTVLLLAAGMILSVWWWRDTWLWWVFLLVPFFLTQVLTTGDLNGARGVVFVPILYLFVGLCLHAVLSGVTSLGRPFAGVVVAGVLVLSIVTTRSYFAWVQSPRLVQDLYPSFPVAEFPAWQAHVLDWTKRTDDFFNVYMWDEVKRQQQAQAAQAPNGSAP